MTFSWPSTPRTLLTRIANLAEGEDDAEWTRFVDLYGPAIAGLRICGYRINADPSAAFVNIYGNKLTLVGTGGGVLNVRSAYPSNGTSMYVR